jgi:RHS repeat-associated protein
MKSIISTLIAAIIVFNNFVGGPPRIVHSESQVLNISFTNSDTPELITLNTINSSSQLTIRLDSPSEPLQCNSSEVESYYLGPVIPETLTIINDKVNSYNPSVLDGIDGIITTDFYVGAIVYYSVEGFYETSASRYSYRNGEITNVWKPSTDKWGYQGNPTSGKYCSVITHKGKSSTDICNIVCPDCESYNPPGNDPGARGCYGGDSDECKYGGREVALGFRLAHHGYPDAPLYATFNNIQLVYFGIPKSLPPRSKLSDNQPKNAAGDSRECEASRCDDSATSTGDPIDVLTGNFNYSYTDLSLETIAGTLSLQRSYATRATDTAVHPTNISPGWTHNQDSRLLFEGDTVWFKGHTLNQYRFDVVGDHLYDPYNGVLANLIYSDGQYILTTSNQSVYVFDGSGRLLTWTNERGHGFTYTYSGENLDRVTEPVSGRYLQFNYLGSVLQSITDSAGRQVAYTYDGNDNLIGVTDVRGNTWSYGYNDDHQITTVYAPGAPPEVLLTIAYDDQGRAYEQLDGAGSQLTHIDFNPDGSSTSTDASGIPINYTPDCRGVVTRTEIPAIGSVPGYFIDRGYDHNFNLTSIRGEDDKDTTSFHWSKDGANLTKMTDQAGYTTTFSYDSQNHVTRVDAPEGEWTTFNYNGPLVTSSTESSSLGDVTTFYTYTTSTDAPQPINLLKTTTDALGNVTSFEYDALGQLITITDTDLNETLFTYDAPGQVTSITDALGRVSLVNYDPSGAVTRIVENYDPGRLPNEENQYNLSTSYEYDPQGRLETVKDTNDVTITATVYDDAGRIYQLLDAVNYPTTYTYNDDGTLDNVLIAPDYLTSYEYDELNRVTGIRDSLGHLVTAYTYNSDSTVATGTDAAGLTTSYTYDALHRVIQASDNDGHVVSTTYDAYGDTISITDSLGRVTSYEYADPGRLTSVVENYLAAPPSGYDPNATNIRTDYTYDILGNLMKIKDAGGHDTSYTYTNLYQLESVTDPLGHITSYTYDALGNQKTVTRPDTTVTQFDYDLVNRLTGIDYPSGTDPDVSFTYDALSEVTGIDDALGHTSWSYNLLGQPETITDPYFHTVAYQYDTFGNRTSLTYPGGRMINYQYNADGLLEEVLDGTTSLVAYNYDSADRLLSDTYANGVISNYSYDLSSQLTGISHTLNNQELAHYKYTYNKAGNLIQTEETSRYPIYDYFPLIINNGGDQNGPVAPYPAPENFFNDMDNGYPAPELNYDDSSNSFWDQVVDFFSDLFGSEPVSAKNIAASIPPDQTITYTYDALDRLKSASYSSGMSFSYDYNKVGNRTSQTINSVTTSYIYDIANRLTSVNDVNYTWNDNGSLLNDGLMNYSYDPAGRLAGITSAYGNYQFGYDGLGNRYSQTIDGLTKSYTLDLAAGLTQVLEEGTTTYLYGLGLIGQETDGELELALSDRLGSVRQLVSDDQQVTLLKSYDPFGNTLDDQGEGTSGFSYTGEQMDESGLEYLRARYYDSKTGRFITADPFPGTLSLPATQNAYPYGINNPLSYTDPSGEILPIIMAGVAGGIIGGGISIATQCLGSSDMSSCMKCMDWGKVGTAVAAGAVAGFVGFGVGLAFAAIGTGLLPTMIGGFYAGLFSGQAYRATELALTGRLDQAGSVIFQPKDLYQDGMFGAAGSAVGWVVGKVINNLGPQRLTPKMIGDAAERIAAKNLPIQLKRSRVPSLERNRYYDGILKSEKTFFVEIKTSTRGVVYGTKFNRAQALFDSNIINISGQKPIWIFVNSRPSSPFLSILNKYKIPYIIFWE